MNVLKVRAISDNFQVGKISTGADPNIITKTVKRKRPNLKL